MDYFLDAGIQGVLWLQANAAWAEPVARWLSFLGTAECFLLLVPVIFWCVDSSIGIRLAVLLVTATSVNSLLKMAFHMPRPYWYDLRVQALGAESTYGMPSGHSVFASLLWPWLGARMNRRIGLAAGLLLALAVALARILLGVHFPADVVVGLAIGAVLWWIAMRGMDWAGPRLQKAGLAWQIALAVMVSAGLILLQALVLASIAGGMDPADWAENAMRAGIIAPRDPAGLIIVAGLILGLGAGLACQKRWALFRADGAITQRVIRFLFGMLGLFLVWQVLGLIVPGEPQVAGYFFRYIQFALMGFWVVFGAPWVFLRVGLVEKTG